jgi:hypothetical protein
MRNLRQQESDALAHAGFSENTLMLFATIRRGWGQWLHHDLTDAFFGNQGVLLIMTETELTVISRFSKSESEITTIPLAQTSEWSLTAEWNYFLLTLTYQGEVQHSGIDSGQHILIDEGRTQHNLEILIQNGFFGRLPKNAEA